MRKRKKAQNKTRNVERSVRKKELEYLVDSGKNLLDRNPERFQIIRKLRLRQRRIRLHHKHRSRQSSC